MLIWTLIAACWFPASVVGCCTRDATIAVQLSEGIGEVFNSAESVNIADVAQCLICLRCCILAIIRASDTNPRATSFSATASDDSFYRLQGLNAEALAHSELTAQVKLIVLFSGRRQGTPSKSCPRTSIGRLSILLVYHHQTKFAASSGPYLLVQKSGRTHFFPSTHQECQDDPELPFSFPSRGQDEEEVMSIIAAPISCKEVRLRYLHSIFSVAK